jgi:membrane protein required for colicin V production
MNWVDYLLLALIVVAMVFGSRRGTIREAMGLIAFMIGIVFATHYIDWLANGMAKRMALSPVLVSFVGFVVLIAFVYLVFRILALVFYRVASVERLGRVDHVGGALVGVLRGWVMLGFILFLLLYLPLPASTLEAMDDSVLAPGMRNTIPMLYESTSLIHPSNDSFMNKVRAALDVEPQRRAEAKDDLRAERRRIRDLAQVRETLEQMETRMGR